jgi:hypothetical protein
LALVPPLDHAALLALTGNQELVLIFVVLPIVAVGPVIAFVNWRWRAAPAPVRISTILAEGQPARGEVVAVRNLGNILDMKPMVRLELRATVGSEPPFELEVVQAFPRNAVGLLKPGIRLELRVMPDRTAGAVVWDPTGQNY